MNKEERKEEKKFKSISSSEIKSIGLETGKRIPNKKNDSEEVDELIHIANFLSELRVTKLFWFLLI